MITLLLNIITYFLTIRKFLDFGAEVHNVGDKACSIPCSDIDPGEHCDEAARECKCGDGLPSCIGTDKPHCYHGQCQG